MKISNNRKNGKRLEGQTVKDLRERDYYARLGRSNEEGDIIIPGYEVILEIKKVSKAALKDKWKPSAVNREHVEQWERLMALPIPSFYGIKWKGRPMRFFRSEDLIHYVRSEDGMTLEEFCVALQQFRQQPALTREASNGE